jgi:ornithine cyclodeaminase/alanine dehydrogenase-like protein (mu-crystallin family)
MPFFINAEDVKNNLSWTELCNALSDGHKAPRADMREADDALLSKSRIFVDSRETAIHEIGELATPIKNGIITENDVISDFYQLCNNGQGRQTEAEITLFKNGGGAHLDLMTALYIMQMTGK